MKRIGPGQAEAAKELAYALYEIAANTLKASNEAAAYNGLITVWPELTSQAIQLTDEDLLGDAKEH